MSCLSSWSRWVQERGERREGKKRVSCLTGVRQAVSIYCWSACQTDQVSSIWRQTLHCACPDGQRDMCVPDSSVFVMCKYHKTRPQVSQKTVLNNNRALKQGACIHCCLFVRQRTHALGSDYFMVSLRYTVPFVKWELKDAVLNRASVFPDSKVLLCRGPPFATCWACSLVF